jgi:pathogenesis-related protein 1
MYSKGNIFGVNMNYKCVVFFIVLLIINNSLKSQSGRITFTEADRGVILAAHNSERRLVGNLDLTWDYGLEEFAADWAQTLSSRGEGLSHRPNNKYGENCYWTSSTTISPEEAIIAFNSEKKIYNYGPISNENWRSTGHYTQVVWYNTTKVGCAAVTGSSGTFVVCNYNPPGNYMGDYPYKNSTNGVREFQRTDEIISRGNNNINVNGTMNRAETALPTTNELAVKISERKRKNSNSNTFFATYLGIESWTKYQSSSIVSRINTKSKIPFGGASSNFQLVITTPKKSEGNVARIRGLFSIGCTLSNVQLQQDINMYSGFSQLDLRRYSPLNYELGLQCWKYVEVSAGQILFGLQGTENSWDCVGLNKCRLRIVAPLGGNITVSMDAQMVGQNYNLSQWNMASFGFSLRSRFY